MYNVCFFRYGAWRARNLLVNDNLTTSYQMNNFPKALDEALQTTKLNFENCEANKF